MGIGNGKGVAGGSVVKELKIDQEKESAKDIGDSKKMFSETERKEESFPFLLTKKEREGVTEKEGAVLCF